MIVVDTSVWVDFLDERATPQVGRLTSLIRGDAPTALTDVVLTELLRGVATQHDADKLDEDLARFPTLQLNHLDDFRAAAQLYRTARNAGYTIGSVADLLIAAICVREDAPILHADADFDRLASCTPLRVFE